MASINMVVGLPASGKTTHINKCKWADDVVISSDAIRKELYGDESIQGDPNEVFGLMFKRVCAGIENNNLIWYDATNINRKKRIAFINAIKNRYPKLKVPICANIISAPFEICCTQNDSRERHVPLQVIERMYQSFQMPCTQEGFSKVMLYPHNFYHSRLDEELSGACDISHDNFHHTRTIGDHCLEAEKFIRRHYDEVMADIGWYWANCVAVAARYHDIGKLFCKTNIKSNGDVDTNYHYYGHENTGAYDVLCYLDYEMYRMQQKIDIALLINYHMVFYSSNAHMTKVRQFLGEQVWKALVWLNKADKAAH